MPASSHCLTTLVRAGALACVSAVPVWASPPPERSATSATGPRLDVLEHVFAEQKEEILAEIHQGRYAKMDRLEKQEVLGILDRMSRLLEGVESAADMSPEGRVALINSQNLVNLLLGKADADLRVVCRRGTTVGSHFRTTQCETVGERRERHRLAKEETDEARRAFTGQRLERFACGQPQAVAYRSARLYASLTRSSRMRCTPGCRPTQSPRFAERLA